MAPVPFGSRRTRKEVGLWAPAAPPGPGKRSDPAPVRPSRWESCRGAPLAALPGKGRVMEEELPDDLEDWVAVKENLFSEPERPNLCFLVAWNESEAKFAVTCHNRTLQQQRRRRRRAGLGPAPGDGGAPAEGEEEEEEGRPLSWAGLFSVAELQGVHRMLAAMNSQLEAAFPELPPEVGPSLWALLFPAAGPDEEALRQQCDQLARYLDEAVDRCGAKMLLDLLFPADAEPLEEYFENLHEFRKKALRRHVVRAQERLCRIVHEHNNAVKMIDLMKVYEEEDKAYQELVTVATNFYEYLLQPFRDMRELATLYKLKISKSLEFHELGPKRIEALEKEAREWTRQADEAVTSIQDITVNYFKETANALAGMKKQMEQDKERFGQATWALAAPRLEKLKLMLARETLQYKRAKELCLNRKRVEIQKKVEHLSEAEKNIDMIDELEMQYYEVQLELYEVQLEILKFKEMLLITELDATRRLIKEKQDEVVYYDAVENPEELIADHLVAQNDSQVSEMKMLKQKSQQLEHKRGIICARRAYLRNKKDQCKASHHHKLQRAQENIKRFYQHHNIQVKRDKRKEEEKEKQEWISQERQKTLQRLKSFREKCPGQFVLKTPHSKPISPKLPKDISQKISSSASQPLSTVHLSSNNTSTPSSKVGSLETCKYKNSPGNIPSQVLVPFGDLPHSETSREPTSPSAPILLAAPPPPLPSSPPPPPPPPPPLPSSSPLSLKTSGRDYQPLPLVCESTAKKYDSSKSSLNLCTGTMDKVLDSLKHGAILHKIEKPTLPTSGTSVRDNILAAIKQGVKLKKVPQEPITDINEESSSELEKSIKAALQRIKRVSADSEEDDNEDQNNTEWDS
ncbi:WASP homolog-associated protein with actin, membranes and microtubules [Sarcophilus harrisii]|uniref:WASP homolog associated with actin, golgi membranes and microtubules n=1 Tax=Sarcophilus harrisii TaxID=9305 RepID=G3WYX3_SARHA|nr:WASP homolog-associated protein with actin, membranes and microtubules [Sarcophilus harrisii]